ncbi:polysialic acid transporter KpsD [Sneathiella chinensis]|uniref:Polysialic acid transporter KpsD n=2 Tax=Sneathiella chinensis TaxID=349750 RepID=A0ABQ5U5L3_9PROT|nr:polysialic acid transporter KpsD [Sneathiella chinensis]
MKLALGAGMCSALLMSGALAQTTSNAATVDNPFASDMPASQSHMVPVIPTDGEVNGGQSDIVRNPALPNPEETTTPYGQVSPVLEEAEIFPFGHQLFAKSNFVDQSLSVNSDYAISPGDRIVVKMWGARVYENVLSVDVQGNIFIPEVGPIYVEGSRNSQLNSIVGKSVSRVFTDNVKVYTNLLGTQPIGVFVTGAVKYPGRYPGAKSDSILYYLSRAGGVDPEQGSYRSILVRRKGETLASVDLYNFLVNGDLADVQFEDKDTIVVGAQLPTVSVSGEVKNSYKFEIDPRTYSGADVLRIANPKGTASHVLLKGVRGDKAISQFITMDQAQRSRLAAGDQLFVESDQTSDEITVKVSGNTEGASTLTVSRSATLGQIANLIKTDPLTHELGAIYIRRPSVAERQKRAIEKSLYELQRSVLTGSSSSTSASQIRVQEAQLIDRFVQQARAVEPEGRVVLSGVDWSGTHVEDGDEIVIPEKTDVVFISGEVKVPQTILWREEYSSADYIEASGGLSNRGDDDRLVIVRLDGSVHDGSKKIMKGDQILVLPRIDTKLFAMFKDLVEITYRVALSAAVVLRAD